MSTLLDPNEQDKLDRTPASQDATLQNATS